MPFVLPIAQNNTDAMKRVGDRLQGDVGSIIAWAKTIPNPPFWAIARTLFPIAESVAWLLIPGNFGTSERLSGLFNSQLAALNGQYAKVSHIIGQIWRHGLTHGDEPPALVVQAANPLDQRLMSWRLILNANGSHLSLLKIGQTVGQVTFSLESFHDDLLALCRDPASIQGFAPGEVSDRYNSWTVQVIDVGTGTAEQKKAANQIKTLLP